MEKHVIKTGHNTFEITVKVKKPHALKGIDTGCFEPPIIELINGNTSIDERHKQRKLDKKRKSEQQKQERQVEDAKLLQQHKDDDQVRERQRRKITDQQRIIQELEKENSEQKGDDQARERQRRKITDQQRIIQELEKENSAQKDEISALNTQLEKAQAELKEYTETIRELYDLATLLKNENLNLLERKEEKNYEEKLTKSLTENELLKKHLTQLTQRQDHIIKPKDEELRKLKHIVNEVKTTLADEIIELQQMQSCPATTPNSSGAAKTSLSLFRNINLTDDDEEQDDEDYGKRSESAGTSISEIPTMFEDDDSIHSSKLSNAKTSMNKQRKDSNSNLIKKNNKEEGNHDKNQNIEEDSNSTQYLYLLSNGKDKEYEHDELDGLRH